VSEFPAMWDGDEKSLLAFLKEKTDDVTEVQVMVVNDLPMRHHDGRAKLMENCCGVIKTCSGETIVIHRQDLAALLNDGVFSRMRIQVRLVPLVDR